jgi:hypothetical protein
VGRIGRGLASILRSAHPERVLQLPLGHFRAALDVPTFRFLVKFPTGVSVGFTGPASGRTMSSRGLFLRVSASHRGSAFALSVCADMRFSLALLLRGPSLSFFPLGAAKVAAIALFTGVFRGAGFAERNRYCLTAVPDLASLAAAASFQFAVLELMHHPAGDAFLAR